MSKIRLTTALAAAAIVSGAASADVIAFQSFEGASTDTYGYTPDVAFFAAGNQLWGTSDTIGAWVSGGSDGANMLVMRNTLALVGVTFDSLDLSNYEDVEISFDYIAQSLETTDYLNMSVNGAESTVIIGTNTTPGDTNDVWVTQTVSIADGTTTLDFSLFGETRGSGDFVGIDNIVVSGTLVPAPASLGLLAAGLGAASRRRRA